MENKFTTGRFNMVLLSLMRLSPNQRRAEA
jgi:hypothetical protein